MKLNIFKSFIAAEWKHLVIINYVIDPDALKSYLPAGTVLDIWNNKCYLSLIGFRFLNTKIAGIPVPYHGNFEEINLRFYVLRIHKEEIRRGVVFIREIVPKKLVSIVANNLYNENYITLKTRHSIDISEESPNKHASYSWLFKNRWNNISLKPVNNKYIPDIGSEAEFITEHYWGYSHIDKSSALEYRVQHPKWSVWNTNNLTVNVNFDELYGSVLSQFLTDDPYSAYIAEGSEVTVSKGRKYRI